MDSWVSKVTKEVEELTQNPGKESEPWRKQSIYRVPSGLKDKCRKAYTPQKVSIGPYHHGAEWLNGMEEHKHRALLHFLKRSRKPLQCYIDALARVVEDLKDAYDQLELKWKQDTEAFLELMIVDGCFILELMRSATAKPEDWKQMGYAENDPIFGDHGLLNIVPHLKRDILMLENQLPLLVLVTLFRVENDMPMIPDDSQSWKVTSILILEFLSQPHEIPDREIELGKGLHILDVHQRSLRRPYQKITINMSCRRYYQQQDYGIMRSATDLNAAGIKFKQSRMRSLTDISFHERVLKLPLMVVDEAFESEYLNLMAFERYHVGAGREVTSYIYFMSRLIRDARDVRQLSFKCDLLKNMLGNDQAVADLLNSLSRDIMFDPNSRLNQVTKQVTEYCQSLGSKLQARFRLSYLARDPFCLITILAFYLTAIQTLVSVLSYNPKQKIVG